jgi:two-component system alkaline phosphatase synthesis response regulator PhoP
MTQERLLVIEDERNIAELIKYNLQEAGYRVSTSPNGQDGLAQVRKKKPDLVILDLMLPELDGLEVCKIMRQNDETAAIPILMLTAKGEEADRVVGLELGADDYMTKPFSPRELVARVRAVLRRVGERPKAAALLRAGHLEVDTARHIVLVKAKQVTLTPKEYDLLIRLMTSRGRVLSRDALLESVWGYDQSLEIETRTVDMHIGQLRKKIRPESERIVTIKNVGYRFDFDA